MISTAYKNALEWTEELWSLSKILPHAERHAQDRIHASNLKFDAFDTLWALQKKGQATEEAALTALLDWWTHLTAILDDCAPIAGMVRNGARMAQAESFTPPIAYASNQADFPF